MQLDTTTIDSTALQISGILALAAKEKLKGIASLRALLYLHDQGPASLSKVATHCGLSTAAITGTADRLTKLGLVRRDQTCKDRRIIRLELTFEGRNAIARILTPTA
jgi:DNA-binding MarR family transcriptional regulator